MSIRVMGSQEAMQGFILRGMESDVVHGAETLWGDHEATPGLSSDTCGTGVFSKQGDRRAVQGTPGEVVF